jgi:hypothetical protein
MMHDYHDGLPGFHPDQILHDGCGECEHRAARDDHGLSNLDMGSFARAWARAAEWNKHGLPTLSRAEAPLLQMLWAVQLHFERRGIPIGILPSPDIATAKR